MKIAVVGLGYVGLSNAIALSQKNNVIAYDIDSKKITLLKNGKSPIKEEMIEEYLKNENLDITFTANFHDILSAEVIIIATPTDYDSEKNYFNTKSIEHTIEKIGDLSNKSVIVKSTVPVGYTVELSEKYNTENIIFSPEFLREGCSLEDVINPSRIVVGDKTERGQRIAHLFKSVTHNNSRIILTDPSEAEAIKLFANTYLANRIAFFNELDTYAIMKGMNTKDIIEGVCADERIGNYYNNPSFGYGGYCLPKDTKQLLANYSDVPNDLISAIVESNKTRKEFIVNQIVSKNPKTIGIYRLIMKAGSDNFRTSSIFDIIAGIKGAGIHVIVYEPSIEEYDDFEIMNNLEKFKSESDLIVANRMADELTDVKEKIYSRDLYGEN